MKNIAIRTIKVIVGISLLAFLFTKVEYDQLRQEIQNANLFYLTVGIMFFLTGTVFEITRLHVLLHKICTLGQTSLIIFIGHFFNNFLPSNIGGDIYKIIFINKKNPNLGKAVTLVFLERFTAIVLLIAAAVGYVLFSFADIQAILRSNDMTFNINMNWFYTGISIIGVGALLGYFFSSSAWFQVLRGKLMNFILQCREALEQVSWKQLNGLILLTLAFHLFRITGLYYLVIALSNSISWASIILILAVVAVISVIPVSIGSLGVLEGSFVLMFTLFGVSLPASLAVALLHRAIIWFKASIGGVFFLAYRHT